jgi:hypothetical protein
VFVGVLMASPQVKIGVIRSISTIPGDEERLFAVGLGEAILALIALGRFDLEFFLLPVLLVPLLDLDHLPAVLGLAQPIRPAHSFVVLAVVLIVLWLLGSPLEVESLVAASFIGHLGSDTGVFPLFSPLSFQYYSLASYRVELVITGLGLAFVSGVLGRYRKVTYVEVNHKSELAAEDHTTAFT